MTEMSPDIFQVKTGTHPQCFLRTVHPREPLSIKALQVFRGT
jgi:hypothetical protein